MKKSSNELFELIKSLNQSETRYFSVYSKRHFTKITHYQQLFNFIKKQTVYNEEEVIIFFKKHKWIKDYAVIKKQLYNLILNALHHFDEFNNIEQDIKKGIHYCYLLIKKGLFLQAEKQIKIYKAKAYKLEKYDNLLELIDLEKKLKNKTFFHNTDIAYIKKLNQEEQTCINKILLSANYWEKSSVIYKQHYQKKISIGQASKELEEIIANKEFSDLKQAQTTKSILDFYQINALYAFIKKNPQKAFEYNKDFLNYLDEKIALRTLFADRYFSVFNNYLIDALLLQKYDLLLDGINKLRTISKEPTFKHINNIDANVFRLSYTLELNHIITNKEYKKGLALINDIDAGLKKHKTKIVKPSIITIRYLMVYILFQNQKYEDCIDQLNIILNDKDAAFVKDIFRDSKFLQILCHFELKNHTLVDSLIISFKRFLLKEEYNFKTYNTLIKYINQQIKNPYKTSSSKTLEALLDLQQKESETPVFNNFDYISWIKSKN